jgi:hypothetical protein
MCHDLAIPAKAAKPNYNSTYRLALECLSMAGKRVRLLFWDALIRFGVKKMDFCATAGNPVEYPPRRERGIWKSSLINYFNF